MRGWIKVYFRELEHPRKIGQDVDSLLPPSDNGDRADEREPLGPVLPVCSAAGPHSLYKLLFFFFFD